MVNFDAAAGLTTMTPSPVASKATPELTMWATRVKWASLTLALSGLLRISEAVGSLAAWFAVGPHAASVRMATASVALGFVFTSPILVDGVRDPAAPLCEVRFLEDHGPMQHRRWRDDFLDGENGLDQFRRAGPRLESLEQSDPDSGPPNQVVADLGQPGVI